MAFQCPTCRRIYELPSDYDWDGTSTVDLFCPRCATRVREERSQDVSIKEINITELAREVKHYIGEDAYVTVEHYAEYLKFRIYSPHGEIDTENRMGAMAEDWMRHASEYDDTHIEVLWEGREATR